MESGAFICIIATFSQKVTGQLFDMRKNYYAIFVQFYCILISEQGMLRKKAKQRTRSSRMRWHPKPLRVCGFMQLSRAEPGGVHGGAGRRPG